VALWDKIIWSAVKTFLIAWVGLGLLAHFLVLTTYSMPDMNLLGGAVLGGAAVIGLMRGYTVWSSGQRRQTPPQEENDPPRK
jgi:hypothetical protein